MSIEAALLVGHLLGDWVFQTDRQAADKVKPGWPGWKAMSDHLVGYHLALLAVLLMSGWAMADPAATNITIAVSAVTHGFIDRRWPVRWLMRATGSAPFADTMWGPLVVDQVLHVSILLACATWWAV